MQAQYNASLNAALTAFFRFGRAKFPEKNTLDETIKGGFDKLPSPIELRKGSLAHSIPFCNHFPPAHNLVLCRDAATTFESAISQQAMESLLPLARFAVGDWSKTNAFLTNDKPLPSTFDKAPKEAQEAATFAILFAKSLSEARFSESPIGSKTFEPFVKKLQHPVPPDAHTMQLLSSAPLMLYGLKAPEKLPVFTSAPNLEQQVLTTFNYDGTIQAKRTVFYQCFTLILECSPSEHFKASLQDKLQDTAFLNGYGFPGSYKRFLERLVNLDSNSAAFPLDHIIDKELDWAFLRAWFASANTAQGLPDNADANMLEYLDEHAPYWPLQGGETIMAWLLARCTYCLHDKKLENAIQLYDTVLAKNYTCLISHYPALLALSASLKALSGKQGGIQTAAELLQAAPISPKLERAAFRALADLQPQFTTAKFNRLLASLPKHKEYTFWLNLMGISIAYGFPQEPAPTLTVKTTPSQALLAKAFLQFTQK